jgi:hypothetical protein
MTLCLSLRITIYRDEAISNNQRNYMKKFFITFFALILIAVFCSLSFAAEIKFSGSYYIAGIYLDKTSLKKDAVDAGPSTAFYYQRLRVRADFIVAAGLSLVTRFDTLERAWGAPRSAPSNVVDTLSPSAGSRAENENIAFDWAYLSYASPIGVFNIGYQNDGAWGTVFGDTSRPNPKISWIFTTGPWMFLAQIIKVADNSATLINPATAADLDYNKYVAALSYYWKDGEAGLLGFMARNAANRQGVTPPASKQLFYGLLPYFIVRIGPVKIQAEIDYYWGKYPEYEPGAGDNVRLDNLAGFFDVTADWDMFYAGASFAYIAGDDPGTSSKMEGGLATGGRDWEPCLILWNQDRTYWAGALAGYDGTVNEGPMSNAWFFQIRGGVRPIDVLDIMFSVSYATADRKPAGIIHYPYGWEMDLVGVYKITNNLSYMIGAGYLFTGAYYKGAMGYTSGEISDNFLIINKLTFTF